jgi:P pilus assembly chaperone PapD
MNLRESMIFLLLSLWICESVNGALLVDKAIVVFDDRAGSKQDVAVINDDAEDKLYVKIEAFRVQAPGTVEEELVPMDKNSIPEFVATPAKMIVPPGGKSIVRLLDLNQTKDEERIYRINILPISRPIEIEAVEGEESVRSMVEILIAYQVLAIILPVNPVATPFVQRQEKLVTVSNSGNANFLLSRGRQCNPLDSEECVELPNKRIYPGNVWKFELPYDGPFSYEIRTHGGNSPSLFR